MFSGAKGQLLIAKQEFPRYVLLLQGFDWKIRIDHWRILLFLKIYLEICKF